MTFSSEKQSPSPADAAPCCASEATQALQTTDEDRWAQRLGLAIAPRLSLVDEENASLITGAERAFLEQQEEADTQGKDRSDERKTA